MKIAVHSSKTKNGEPIVKSSGQEAERPASSGPYAALLRMQSALGNHAFAKLLASPANSFQSSLPPQLNSVSQTSGEILQRKCACGGAPGSTGECGECRAKRLQRKAANGLAAEEVPPVAHEVVGRAGRPLDAATRNFFETRFGHDFSAVRVHTDARAAESARAVNAHAYTLGHNLVFATGKFTTQSNEGRRLIAHELVHVIQQSGLAARSGSAAAAEGEARSVARRVAAGQSARVQISVPPAIQRAPADEPLSLRSTYNPGAHTYEELVAEAWRVHHWLEKNPVNSPDRSALEAKLKEIIQTANRLGARLGYSPLSFVDVRAVSKSPEQTQALDQINKLSQPSATSPFLQPPQPRSSPTPQQKTPTVDALPAYVVWTPLFLEGLKEGLRMDEKLQRGFETLQAQLNSSQGKMEFGGGMALGIVPGALVAVADIPYSAFKLLAELGVSTNFGKMSKEEIDKAVENLIAGVKKIPTRLPEVIGDIAAQPREAGGLASALISEKIRQDLFLEEPEKKAEPAPATNARPGKPSVMDILGIASPAVELPDLYKAARDKITKGKEGGKGGYVFNKGVAAGMALGYTLMNVAMLFIGPEEMAAKAGSLGAKGAEALAASRLWKRLGSIAESIPELKALAGAKRAAAEAKAGGTAVKGAEGLVEGGGKAAARVAEERLPASVAKDVITKEEALVEVEFINKHPERVKGSPPRAELGGEGPTKHEIVQLPDGTCERHSKKMPVPCPAVFKPKGTTSGEVKTTSSDLPHGDIVFGPAGGVPEGQFEYLRDQSGRPLAVEGWWNAEGATRNKAAQSAVSGPYNALSSRSTNAAHLAGRQGGGRGDAVNLVPVLREINHPQMSALENSISKRVKAGEHMYIQVRVSYRGTGNIPHEITYSVFSPKGDALRLTERVVFGEGKPSFIH